MQLWKKGQQFRWDSISSGKAATAQTSVNILYLQFVQNVLLNDHSLRTLASLTWKYGGSFVGIFTVYGFTTTRYWLFRKRDPTESLC